MFRYFSMIFPSKHRHFPVFSDIFPWFSSPVLLRQLGHQMRHRAHGIFPGAIARVGRSLGPGQKCLLMASLVKFSIIRICIMNIFNIYIYICYNIYIYTYYVKICIYIYIYIYVILYIWSSPLIYLEAFYMEIRWAITPSLGIIGVDHGGWAYNAYICIYVYMYICIYVYVYVYVYHTRGAWVRFALASEHQPWVQAPCPTSAWSTSWWTSESSIWEFTGRLPSGKNTKNYGQSPLFNG